MAVEWTRDQRRVIDARNQNILVSAAAGSGKTAVLVERIISRIKDPVRPVGIDELLIVTFTRAAAAEMRERLARRLAEESAADPADERLREQTALIHSAQITTIDGFCSYVIREYGYRIDLVPGFRTADEGEAALLRSDVTARVLEEAHADPDPAFREAFTACVETFATGKNERPLEEAVMSLVSAADAGPDPEGFLMECLKNLNCSSAEDLAGSPWMRVYMADADALIEEALALAERNLALAEEADGPSQYLENARPECAFFRSLRETALYEERRKLLAAYTPRRLSTKKNPGADPDKVEAFKERRAGYEEIRKKKLAAYYQMPLEEAYEVQAKSAGPLRTLVALAQRFRAAYAEEKEGKSLVDFSDLEHFALRILRAPDGSRTEAARELAGLYREVLIDEYQDSNYLQEAILTAVSRIEDGEPDYFCVGDVKQSIYSFRQARPDLFMEKYDRYGADPETGERIDLHKNFRSRAEVVDSVNAVFAQIMPRTVGGVAYDEEAALVTGASYPDGEGYMSELLAVLTDQAERGDVPGGEELSEEEASVSELEARAIGKRIRELIAHQKIFDPACGGDRPLRCGDIVILLRSMGEKAETLVRVLNDMRIPAVSTAKSAYFTAPEVELLLSYLSLLDNPLQDIPCAAALHGPFAGLDFEDLAEIRAAGRKGTTLYEAAREYAEAEGGREQLRAGLRTFFDTYDDFRDRMGSLRLSELVYAVIAETGFADYEKALPGGAQRALNLETLADRAMEFEKTSYAGLFNFIRYIENLKKANQDFGELSAMSGSEDVVRISTIHKSKGLEYPVVFVAGLSRRFNLTDVRKNLLIHPGLGIASYYIDYRRRLKMPTLLRSAIERRLIRDQIGEELRVLYVALTRAQQKLILCGTVENEEAFRGLSPDLPAGEKMLPDHFIMSAGRAFALLVPAVVRANGRAESAGEKPLFDIRFADRSSLIAEEVRTEITRETEVHKLGAVREAAVYDAETRREMEERFSYVYPDAGLSALPIEMSVSELKKIRILPENMAEEEMTDADFARGSSGRLQGAAPERGQAALSDGDQAAGGAARGTVVHRFLELVDYPALGEVCGDHLRARIAEQIVSLRDRGHFTEEEAALISPGEMERFLRSDLGQRMKRAAEEGTLHREQPFVVGMDASEIRPDWPKNEMVYVQGIIDAYFVEDGGITLVDYKTDRVRSGDLLSARYRDQLRYYAEALARITGLPVREKLIWSFALGEAVPVRRDPDK